MAFTQADLDAVNRAIAAGATKVRFADGREVTYRSLTELRSTRDEIAAAVVGRSSRVRTTLAAHRRV